MGLWRVRGGGILCRGCGDGKTKMASSSWHVHIQDVGQTQTNTQCHLPSVPTLYSSPPPSHLSQRSLCTQRLSQSILSPPSFIIIRLPILCFFSFSLGRHSVCAWEPMLHPHTGTYTHSFLSPFYPWAKVSLNFFPRSCLHP